jgi:hypothetical protein
MSCFCVADGDARRSSVQLELALDANFEDKSSRFKGVEHDSFLFSARRVTIVDCDGQSRASIADIVDQDWLHGTSVLFRCIMTRVLRGLERNQWFALDLCAVLKRLWTHLCKISKVLKMGDFEVSLHMLEVIFNRVRGDGGGEVDFGLRADDVKSPIKNKMDTGPPLRAARQVRRLG